MNFTTDQSLQFEIDNQLENFRKNEYEVSKDVALSIIKKIPNHILSWKILGVIYSNTGQSDEALIASQEVLKLAPQDPESHNNLGVVLFRLSKLEEAEKSYNKAIELKPDYAEAYNNLADVLKDFGKIEAAVKNYKKAIELKQDYVVAHYQLGIMLQQLGKLEEAKKSYNKAIELKPDYAEAYTNLANTFKELGKLDQAEKSYNKAIQLKPNFAVTYLNMGIFLKEIGKTDEAIKYFEKTIKIDPQDKLGANLELACLGKRKIPTKTPTNYMKNFYKVKSKTWSNLETNKYFGRDLIEDAFKQTHTKQKKINILDLGCGTGGLARFLHSYANTLTGLDFSKEMLNEAKKTGFYDSLLNKRLEEYLSETSIYYDSIVAAAVMIHFLDLESVFELINERLKLNGKFIFSVFESNKNDKELNSFLMYSHSDDYITRLAENFKFKITYRQKDVHEYHKKVAINAIIYVLQKS